MVVEFEHQKIKRLRVSKGLSLRELARQLTENNKTKVSRSALLFWETGETHPNLRSLIALANFYEKNVEYFFKRR
ncbi:MAG: helix-turn-helix transcriptional regulator [Candidatus Omnitrophica bacterium]|nr:helix-turn-helix transcriptional regulator [Candidatus Omnitrophota bacterium]